MTSVATSAPSILNASSPTNPESHIQIPGRMSTSGRAPSPGPINIHRDSQSLDKRWPAHALRLSTRSNTSALSTDTSLSLKTDYRGPIIPPYQDKAYQRRTLVLCFDGTGDQFDLDNSNVIQFFSVLKKGDRKRQLVYYQSGIGTYTIPQVATPLYSKVSKTLDLMVANHLNHHVMSGYKFLMENFKEGDKICIFGFSRGAYTARALAGMVHKVGLLPAGNEQQVPFAYNMFKKDTELGWKQSVAFKKTFSMDVDIDFVGVWDTVASVGLLPTVLPFTKSNTAIKVFRHALSLDEHRAKFKPSIYQRITAEEARRGDFTPPPSRGTSPTYAVSRGRKQGKVMKVIEQTEKVGRTESGKSEVKEVKTTRKETQDSSAPGTTQVATSFSVTRVTSIQSSPERRSGSTSRSRAILGSLKRSAREVSDGIQEVVERVSLDREQSKDRAKAKDKDKDKEDGDDKEDLSPDSERDRLEQMYLDRSRPTDVQEVWFAGCHCDVGGGSVPNNTPNSLARIPLRWMIRECFLARTGIQFEAERLRELGLDPATLYPRVTKPPHLESLDPQLTEPVSPPPPLPPKDVPRYGNSLSASASMKQEITGTRSSVDEGFTQEKVSVRNSEDKSASIEGTAQSLNMRAPDMSDGHGRHNNISLSATLVDHDVESMEAPNVHVEGASVVDLSAPSEASHSPLRGDKADIGSGTRLSNDTEGLKPFPIAPSISRGVSFLSTEAQAEVSDARSGVYDQLKLAKWWWALEFLPMRERVQLPDGTWKKKWSMNRGKPRIAPQEEPLMVHRSVKMRMEAKDLNYTPRLKFTKEPVWVD